MQGSNRGQGQGGGQGSRNPQSRAGFGPGGMCVCSQCGHSQPHERGVPCMQIKCPKCGGAMCRG